MLRVARIGIALVVLALAGSPAAAQEGAERLFAVEDVSEPTSIRADVIESDLERDVHTASGDVVIVQGDRTLRADWVAFSRATGRGVASGAVELQEDDDVLEADFLHFDVETLRGVVFDGRLDTGEGGFILKGREVAKTGEETYRFEDAGFTTCRCPDEEAREPWEIRAGRADLEVGGYATARNTTLEILGIPAVWLPWMIYPVKTERQTGFLFPELSTSGRNGFEVGLPFFWAARRNLNVLVTPRWLSDRGYKPELGLEYVFGEESKGELFASFIQDDEVEAGDRETPFDDERWAVEWRHDHFLPWDTRLRVDLSLVSDNQHPFDFDDLDEHRRDRFLESVAFLERHFGETGRYGLTAGVLYADDLQSPTDVDRDDYLLQRLPEVAGAALPRPAPWLSRLVPSLDASYTFFRGRDRAVDEFASPPVVGDDLFLDTGIDAMTNRLESRNAGRVADFSRDDFARNGGPEGDGVFQEGEPLADTGHRLLLQPRLAMPWRLGGIFELYPEVGYHETLYETEAQGFEERGLFTGRLDLRTRLRRRFDAPLGSGEWLHLLEPRVGYAVLEQRSQRGNPLLVPPTATPQERVRQLELENVILDRADRIERHNGVTLGVANRIYRRGEDGGIERLVAEVALSSQYLFSTTEPGDIFLEGELAPIRGLTSEFIFGYDPDDGEVSEGLFELGYRDRRGNDVTARYRFVRDIPAFFESFRGENDRFEDFESGFGRVSQGSIHARVALPLRFAATYDAAYSFEQSLLLANEAGLEYVSKCDCWAIRVELSDDRNRGLEVNLRYTLLGLGRDTVRPFSGGRGGSSRDLVDGRGGL